MANHMPLASRVEFLEKSLGDSAAKHGQDNKGYLEQRVVQRIAEVFGGLCL